MKLSVAGRRQLEEGLEGLGVEVEPAQVEGLGAFAVKLLAMGRERGVTGLANESDVLRELILDAVAAAPLLPSGATVADLGSGGGVPGIPLAMVRPDCHFILVEAALRKARWLSECIEELGLATRVEVRQVRAEDLGRDPLVRGRLEAVVSKALAALPVLVELALPLLHPGGRLLALKGPALEEELNRSTRALSELRGRLSAPVSYRLGDRERVVCVVEKSGPTPDRYPRRAGIPERKPL